MSIAFDKEDRVRRSLAGLDHGVAPGRRRFLALPLMLAVGAVSAQHEMHDHGFHTEELHLPSETPAHLLLINERRRGSALALLFGGTAKELLWLAPANAAAPFPNNFQFRAEAAQETIALNGDRARLSMLGTGNYHIAYAIIHDDSGTAWHAATTHYFSAPGPAPREALGRLERTTAIVPLRLPREHSTFRCGETWAFRVLRNGTPVNGAEVTLWLPGSGPKRFTSDPEGIVEVRFPDALAIRAPLRHGSPAPIPFVVAARLSPEEGVSWSGLVRGPKDEGRSALAGWGAITVFAALGGIFTLRRRSNESPASSRAAPEHTSSGERP